MAYTRTQALQWVQDELSAAYDKHGNEPWSRHEALGIIQEEFDEFKKAVYENHDSYAMAKELAQTAAMCIRYLESGNRNSSTRQI